MISLSEQYHHREAFLCALLNVGCYFYPPIEQADDLLSVENAVVFVLPIFVISFEINTLIG